MKISLPVAAVSLSLLASSAECSLLDVQLLPSTDVVHIHWDGESYNTVAVALNPGPASGSISLSIGALAHQNDNTWYDPWSNAQISNGYSSAIPEAYALDLEPLRSLLIGYLAEDFSASQSSNLVSVNNYWYAFDNGQEDMGTSSLSFYFEAYQHLTTETDDSGSTSYGQGMQFVLSAMLEAPLSVEDTVAPSLEAFLNILGGLSTQTAEFSFSVFNSATRCDDLGCRNIEQNSWQVEGLASVTATPVAVPTSPSHWLMVWALPILLRLRETTTRRLGKKA